MGRGIIMIDEKELIEQIKSLRITITGLRAEKSILNEYAQHFKDSVIKIIDEQQRVDEWIPVEERLPDKAGVYRVTASYRNKVVRVKDDLFYSDRTWGYAYKNPLKDCTKIFDFDDEKGIIEFLRKVNEL